MLGYITLAAWTATILLGLRMHGVRRMPVGVVLPHVALAFTGYVAWVVYLASNRPMTLGIVAAVVALITNGLGDIAVIRKWKPKAEGGRGVIGTYVQRVRTRRILLIHLVVAGTTTVLAILTVLGF